MIISIATYLPFLLGLILLYPKLGKENIILFDTQCSRDADGETDEEGEAANLVSEHLVSE